MKLRQARSKLRPAAPLLRIAPTDGGRNASYYQAAEHKAWAAAVKQRDGWRCVRCGGRKRLTADHVVEIEDGGAPLDLLNGQTLCQACHNAKTAAGRHSRFTGGGGVKISKRGLPRNRV